MTGIAPARLAQASAGFTLVIALTLGPAPSSSAGGGGLGDNSAVILGSDRVLYTVDLASGGVTAGASLGGSSVPSEPFSGLEASPSADVLWAISGSTSSSLSSIDFATGVSTAIEDDYGGTSGAALEAIARDDAGDIFLAYTPAGPSASPSLSQVNLATGALTTPIPITLATVATRVTAITWVGDVLYAFRPTETDTLYTLNPLTGALTQVRVASAVVTGIVVAADTTSSGEIYLLGFDGEDTSTLYRLNPTSDTTTLVGLVTLTSGVTAENLAIATLLTSEREGDADGESDDSPAPPQNRDREIEEESQVIAPAIPVLATTGVQLDWLLALGVIVAVSGAFLVIVSVAARRSRR